MNEREAFTKAVLPVHPQQFKICRASYCFKPFYFKTECWMYLYNTPNQKAQGWSVFLKISKKSPKRKSSNTKTPWSSETTAGPGWDWGQSARWGGGWGGGGGVPQSAGKFSDFFISVNGHLGSTPSGLPL